ncbi:hypothetical protein J3A83DRAFT_4406797 [Scleroderma citrinum]
MSLQLDIDVAFTGAVFSEDSDNLSAILLLLLATNKALQQHYFCTTIHSHSDERSSCSGKVPDVHGDFPSSLRIDTSLSFAMLCKSCIHSGHQKSIPTLVCGPLRVTSQSIVLVIQIIGAVVMIMRIHALYMGSRCILILLLAVAMGAIGFGAWAFVAHASPNYIPPSQRSRVGCPDGGYISSEQGIYLAAGWSGQLVFDLMIFLLTILRSLRFWNTGSRSLINILLRDGSLYFACVKGCFSRGSMTTDKIFRVMCAVNVVNITVLSVGANSTKAIPSNITNVILPLNIRFSSMMIARLMLNLRDPKIAESTSGISLHPLSHANMVFATVPLTGTTDNENSAVVFEMQ